MVERLQGKRALITGASSGIGLAFAHEFAQRGAALVLTARRRDRLESIAMDIRTKYGVEVDVIPLDLSERTAPLALYEATEGKGLLIHVLVNNAGFGTRAHFVDTKWERTAEEMQLNVVSLVELTRRFVANMVARRTGYVLNVASIGAFLPTPRFTTYGPGKAFVRNFSEGLDFELRGSGVRVTCLCPGPTSTEFAEVSGVGEIKGWRSLTFISAAECARVGVNAMLRGQRLVVSGWISKIAMFLTRFAPRSLATWMSAKLF